MKRTLLPAALAALSLVSARWDYSSADTLAALEGQPAIVRCIVRAETGGTYDPNLIGQAGELGAAQLLPVYGLLPLFYEQGYSDPFDPAQAVAFTARAVGDGLAGHWTPVKRGVC